MNKIPRRVFRQIADKAIWEKCIHSGKGKVGEYVGKLNPEERAAIKDLKSDEIKKDFILTPNEKVK